MNKQKVLVSLLVAGGLASPLAHATNGYFSHGYGMKSKGMAGVGIALPQDSIAAATNPAGMVLVGDRIDFGVDWFRPVRNTAVAGAGEMSGNGDSNFLIPEFGYNKLLNPDSSIGISVYGNGGMNTKYRDLNTRTGGLIFGTGDLGVDLSQLFIAPTYAMKLNADHAVGVSLNLAYQMFRAEGLQNFGVMNPGYDSSTGYGLRIGWTGQVAKGVTLGATYQTRTKMSKFSKYANLFAEQGGFDIPANYGVGIAANLSDTTTIAADIQQIEYSKVNSIGNSMVSPGAMGASNGPGFGWRDMTVFKLGVNHRYDSGLVVRAGYSTGRQPIPDNETMFNVLAPGVVQDHLTLGATWIMPSKSELTLGYMHAFKKTVSGTGATANFSLDMYQDSLGIAYGWKF
jgi:long-chain fatty acid transport protein